MNGRLRSSLFFLAGTVLLIAIWLYGGLYWLPLDSAFAQASQEVNDKSALSPSASFVLSNDHEKGLLADIAVRQKELDRREEELKVREERLSGIKADLDAKAAELGKRHSELEALLKKLDEAGTERARRLVKIFESMGPEDAAPRLEKLDHDVAVMILATISEKKAAKILSFIEPSRSARLSQAIRLR